MKQLLEPHPETEIVSSRVFNCTASKLFEAFSNPDNLKQWWGPNGFTNTFHQFDFRVGGNWKFTMHGPEVGNYENEVVFLKIDPPNLIAWDRITQPYFQMLITIEEMDQSSSKLSFIMKFYSAEVKNKLLNFVPEKNEENFDRLETLLKQMG
ncbi:SRPBCC domain-containing protein [Aegicerativicinus sediminis]|uniref:SRPBCC domain-containing protein n=1 Tax=Aegicerativicinus sediminis TaxID=2893202 RepID=UPI001E654B8B|nr:SRPBCC domain-containing protein [Aegicerativicinus sediminis]